MIQEPYSSEKYFENLFIKYYSPFCLFAKRYIEDMDICKNIVSDVFIVIWNKREELETDSPKILAYLKLLVRNSCLNYIKHLKYERAYEDTVRIKTPLYNPSPETIYTLKELHKILDKTLESLPIMYKEVFIKSFLEEKTQSDIANELKISSKSVFRYRQKIFELLRSKLSDFKMIIL